MRKLFLVCRFTALLALLSSCSPLRNLHDDQALLNKNVVKSDKSVLNEEISAILKQKPNRKILGLFRFHLGVYTLANKGKETKFKTWVKNTIGEEPVILDTNLTKKSNRQVKQYLENAGLFFSIKV